MISNALSSGAYQNRDEVIGGALEMRSWRTSGCARIARLSTR